MFSVIAPTPMQEKSIRFRRWALTSVAVVLLMTAAGSLAGKYLLDEPFWISLLEARVSAASGRQLKIAHVTVHGLPLPGIDAQGVSLANPAWAQQPQMGYADAVAARLAWWPLLRGRIRLVSLTVQGARVHAEVGPDGVPSWRFRTNTANPSPADRDGFDLSHLRAIDLRDTEVVYLDRHGGAGNGNTQSWQIDQFHAGTEPGLRNLQMDALVRHGRQALTATTRLEGDAVLGNGTVELRIGRARLSMTGHLPTSRSLAGAAFQIEGDATQPNDVLEFFDIVSRPLAPLTFHAEARERAGVLQLADFHADLAKLHVSGALQYDPRGTKPRMDAQLTMPRLDWVQTLADAGRPPLPPKLPGELLRTHRLAWRVVAALQPWFGTVDLHFGVLKTRPGVELTNATARLQFHESDVLISPMHAGMLGGTAGGSLLLHPEHKRAHLQLELHDVSLEKWIAALGKKAPLTGGPMQLVATVDATGGSMKELGASLTGPVSIRLGPTIISSAGGAHAEEILTGLMPFLSARHTNQIVLECVGANLPFVAGRAAAGPLVGARSQASQLLTSGYLDLREQTLDLRGRVRARSGFSLGLSTLGGDVKIAGLLTHPQAKLDPAGTPAALARLGAAFASAGLSIVATELWDARRPASDPCQAVFASKTPATRRGQKAVPAR